MYTGGTALLCPPLPLLCGGENRGCKILVFSDMSWVWWSFIIWFKRFQLRMCTPMRWANTKKTMIRRSPKWCRSSHAQGHDGCSRHVKNRDQYLQRPCQTFWYPVLGRLRVLDHDAGRRMLFFASAGIFKKRLLPYQGLYSYANQSRPKDTTVEGYSH